MEHRSSIESQASAREIRVAAGKSQTAAAALAGVAPGTYRCFEANELSVNERNRARCRAAVAQLGGATGKDSK